MLQNSLSSSASPSSSPAAPDRGSAFLYEAPDHRYLWLGAAEQEGDESVPVNCYAIETGGQIILLDPGGVLTFPHVVASLSRCFSIDRVSALFYSHQDPDVSSGIALWMQICAARAYISRHWVRFVPHFGHVDPARIVALPDEGMTLDIPGGASLRMLPAHFLHSVGNFSLYDPRSRILFSGDIGAALFPAGRAPRYIDDFAAAMPYMEGFHRRYLASRAASRRWVAQVQRLEVSMIAPQHGAVLRGRAVQDFLRWLGDLPCGVDCIDEIYGAGAAHA